MACVCPWLSILVDSCGLFFVFDLPFTAKNRHLLHLGKQSVQYQPIILLLYNKTDPGLINNTDQPVRAR